MTDTILVTGAAGFVGQHLLRLLTASSGDAPVVAWHRPAGTPPATFPTVSWQAVDLLDRAGVRAAIASTRPAVVYHCAGAAHVGRAWEDSASTLSVNVRGTHYLATALAESGLATTRVLVPSSALVYRAKDTAITEDDPLQPSSPYALSKLAQEFAATGGAGLDARIARAFNHFGPGQDPFFAASGFARRIADIEAGRWEPEVSVGNLEAKRDLTDVRDTVRAYQRIVERGVGGRPYNVCTGRAVAIGDVLDMLLTRARVAIRVKVDPARYRPNDVPILLGDPSRTRSELGWEPQIPLEQTIDDLLADWRARVATEGPSR